MPTYIPLTTEQITSRRADIDAVEINGLVIVLDKRKEAIRLNVYMAEEIAKGLTEQDAIPIVEARLKNCYIEMYKDITIKNIQAAYEKGDKRLLANLLCSLASFMKGVDVKDYMVEIVGPDPSTISLDGIINKICRDCQWPVVGETNPFGT